MFSPQRLALVSLTGLALVDCGAPFPESDDDPGMDFSAVAIPGAWRLPSDVHATGQRQSVRYDGAPAWNGGANCGSGLGAPARALGDYLRRTFPASVSSYGGFACRPNTANTSQLSVHGTGRAIDVFIPTTGGQADNTRGDPVANWLVVNAQRLGVQYIIWDRTQWNGSRTGDKVSPYGGPHPHHDHLHVELNTSARPIEVCTAHCEAGDVIVSTDCGRGDCNAFGARCVSDGLGTRCVFGTCPATGTARICINDRTLGNCSNGAVSAGDCGAFAAWCSTAGRARTDARCVSGFCVDGPGERPVAHTTCWIEGGQLLRCDANGGATPTPCPAGQACSVIGGAPRCAPRVCPTTGTPDVCVDGRYIASCYNGSVIRASDCGAARLCSTAGADEPRCVSTACVADAREVPRAHAVCLADGRRGQCTAAGALRDVAACPAGQVCVMSGATAACAPGVADAAPPADVVEADVDGTDPPDDDPEDATAPTDDAASDAPPAPDALDAPPDAASLDGAIDDDVIVEGGCGCRASAPRPARGVGVGLALALMACARALRRRTR